MAKLQPLRIFFGQFVPETFSPYTFLGDSNDDNSFPSFLTGMFLPSSSQALHSRKPVMSAGFVYDWDEYLDLKAASVEPSKGNKIAIFEDVAGAEHIVIWDDEADSQGLATNKYQIETWANEFLHPTNRLSLPYPRPDAKYPYVFWHGDNVDLEEIAGYRRLHVVLWKSTDVSQYSSPTMGFDIAINNPSSGNQTIRIQNPNSFTCKYSLFMNERETNVITGALENSTYPKVLFGHDQTGSIVAEAYIDITVDIATVGYVTPAEWLEAPALNDAIARLNFDYENHARLALNGSLKHEILILNSATHKYFKGLIVQVNPIFTDGVPRRTEDAAVFTVQVTEEGSWADEAWLKPNGILSARSNGTCTSPGGWTFCRDANADFVSDGVLIGDKIKNITKNFSTTVVRVIDLNNLEVVGNNDILWAQTDVYEIEYVSRQTLFPQLRKVINE